MTRVFVFTNHKGGVGKFTSATNIALGITQLLRRAKENTARSGLTAIALARQAALLLLTIHGYEIPAYAVGNDFYRQALELDLKSKREYTDAILSAMGGIKRSQFSLIKSLLRLSDEAIELADRHNVEEGKLRHVAAVAPEYHAEIVRQIVDFNLSSKQALQGSVVIGEIGVFVDQGLAVGSGDAEAASVQTDAFQAAGKG